MGEKTQPPTRQRIRQARTKGQVAVSQDLVKLVRLAVVVELAFAMEPWCRTMIAGTFAAAFDMASRPSSRPAGILHGVVPALALFGALPIVAALLVLVATLVQTGFNFAPKALEGSAENLSPAKNLKNLFSGKKLLMVPINLAKAASVLAVCFLHVRDRLPELALLYRANAEQGMAVGLNELHSLVHVAIGALVCWCAVDYALQRLMIYRSLRMDVEEVKRDLKEAEGDPHIKGHRKAVAREIALAPAPVPAKGASAVVVNPQHLAIAIAFDPERRTLPRIVGIGQDDEALQLRGLAAERALPIVKYVRLARELHRVGDDGAVVPRQCLRAVALLARLIESLDPDDVELGNPWRAYEIDDDDAKAVLARRRQSVSINACDI